MFTHKMSMIREAKFKYQMKAARLVMREDRRMLAALAEFDRTDKNPDKIAEGSKQKQFKD